MKAVTWYVKVGILYFIEFDTGIFPTFTIDDAPGKKGDATIFTDLGKAEEIASIVGGEIEEVGDDE